MEAVDFEGKAVYRKTGEDWKKIGHIETVTSTLKDLIDREGGQAFEWADLNTPVEEHLIRGLEGEFLGRLLEGDFIESFS